MNEGQILSLLTIKFREDLTKAHFWKRAIKGLGKKEALHHRRRRNGAARTTHRAAAFSGEMAQLGT